MKFYVQDICTVKDGIVLHGCNAKGVMGAGVALAIKQEWPLAYSIYREVYERGQLNVGEVVWAPWIGEVKIGNCITQAHYGNDPTTKYAIPWAIESCIIEALKMAERTGKKIFMPPIGCGNGNLEWPKVYKIVKNYENRYNTSVTVLSNNRHWVRYARQLNG